jgi:anti-sigma factor RsiW
MHACEHLKENLTLYVYGELDPATGREVENHLENCEGCRKEHERLSTILTRVKEASVSPQLSPMEARAMAANISRTLKSGPRWNWWRQYLEFMPSRLIPAAAMACALIITVAVVGYLKLNDTPGVAPVSQNQNEEIMLSDKDLEILDNLELLKEMDAIQKLSQVVAPDGESEFQRGLDSDTRGMRQDVDRNYLV